jgi:hypothetical protein
MRTGRTGAGKVLKNEILGVGLFRETERGQRGVAEVGQRKQRAFGGVRRCDQRRHRLVPHLPLFRGRPRGSQGVPTLRNLGLNALAVGALFLVLGRLGEKAQMLRVAGRDFEVLYKDVRAPETDASQDFEDDVDEVRVVHRLRQANEPHVTGTVFDAMVA